MAEEAPKPIYFASPAAFREWLRNHHATERVLWVGYHKRQTGTPSLTWPESVDEALCYGWIDGVRRSVDAGRYMIRFTRRRAGSVWSTVNVARVRELTKARRMRAAGQRAFDDRTENRTRLYSYEQGDPQLEADHERAFRARPKAWKFFQSRPPWYRRTATWWVVSAKKPETRLKRLRQLIEDSAAGRTIGPLTRTPAAAAAAKE